MSNLMSNYLPLDVTFVSGNGCWLTDKSGKQYLDALSGVGVVNLGHCHPDITETIVKQSETLLHTSNWYHIEHQEELAKRLCLVANMDNVFFANSGAEANEAAIKIARLFAQKRGIDEPVIISANDSFHGRTMATLSATGNSKIQDGFSPLLSEFIHVEFDDIEAISKYTRNENVVAVMLEPIQGEAGIVIPEPEYLNKVKSLCEKNDWLLILDEVQTGMGRTGKMFAHQYNNITPDLLTLAKGLGNGVPIGACLAKGRAAKLFTTGKHGSTFGGNPLVSKVALSVLDVIENNSVLANVGKMSQYIHTKLEKELSDNAAVISIRIKGLMIGIGLDEKFIDTSKLLQKALDDQLLINIAGSSIRLLPPLIISSDEVDILINKIVKLINNSD
ncbi:MAG: aspartate aminotransferase family protein [Gammaproteobacteria bacterium]|nr:aspartate aminotransferase family protein [Gammaproteobacteria bacterium]MDP6973788.1 aspartate aminotransferase family protein [Gammaproteobacteria bacterium]